MGYVFRVGYNYDNLYLLELSGRYDGHYYFAPGKRFGFFPAVSLGWNIGNESFMKNIEWLNRLKIRGSYGESGNLAGGSYQYLSDYGFGTAGNFGGVPVMGMWENIQGNPNITWEKAKKFDLGIEFAAFNGMLQAEADFCYEKRSNMLMAPNSEVSAEYGIQLSQVNAGCMHNQGVDLMVSFNKQFNKDWTFGVRGTFTYAHNTLDEVFETEATYNNPNRRRTGRPDGTMFGYHCLGYFTYDDFNPDGSLKDGIATQPWGQVYPGDLRYEDLSGPEGVPDGKIDENDMTVIGRSNWNPEIVFGLAPSVKWKGFDLDALFQGATRTNISLGETLVMPFFDSGSATKLQFQDHWTPDNQDARYPRLTSELNDIYMDLPVTRGSADGGRATRGAALTLKGWVELFHASELRNPNHDRQRWENAAKTLKQVIDLGVYDLQPTIQSSWGNMQPTQELVDDYCMSDGLPISESPLYNPQKPYENREKRFYQSILFDGLKSTFWHTQWKGGEPQPPHHITVDMGQEVKMLGFQYVSRDHGEGWPQEMTLETSLDGEHWEGAGTYSDLPAEGKAEYRSYLPGFKQARYFRLTITAVYNGKWSTHVAEINAISIIK